MSESISKYPLINYWFAPENQKKWFAGDKYDSEIVSKFDFMVENLLVTENDNEQNLSVMSQLNIILICDQLVRHYDRYHGTNYQLTPKFADKAVMLSKNLTSVNFWNSFLKLTPAMQAFVLLPLRHTRQFNNVVMSIDIIFKLMERYFPVLDSKDTIGYIISDWYNYSLYIIGLNQSYWIDRNRPGKKIPQVYLNFYKASLECLATLQKPILYSIDPYIEFPNRLGLLDPECPFELSSYNNIKTIDDFAYNIDNDWINSFYESVPINRKVIISISGGGDSMTCSFILKALKYDVTAVMIDYGNRHECSDEVKMVHWWCSKIGIQLYVMHIDSIQRSRQSCLRDIYEKITRQFRFNAYKKVAEIIDADEPHVVLGHNKDDGFENIIANIVKNRSTNDLRAIKTCHSENGVWIYRPIRDIPKDQITNFLWKIGGPCLRDSTPNWSFRGRTRRILCKNLNEFDERMIPGLEHVADVMYDISQRYFTMLEKITTIQKSNHNIQIYQNGPTIDINTILINYAIEALDDESYWTYIFNRLMNEFGYPMVGNKSIKNLIVKLKENKPNKHGYIMYNLAKNMECRVNGPGSIIVYIRPQKS
jgi:tRNA(Ile)-lysidine synthetase-like protein